VVRLDQAGPGRNPERHAGHRPPPRTPTCFPLAAPARAATCTTNGYVGMHWRGSLDMDQADFYNDKLMGFARPRSRKPDGSTDRPPLLRHRGHGRVRQLPGDLLAERSADQRPLRGVPWWISRTPPRARVRARPLRRRRRPAPAGADEVAGHLPARSTSPARRRTRLRQPGGMLVSQLDQGTNPVVACDVQKAQTDQLTFDGSGGPIPDHQTTYAYDARATDGWRPRASATRPPGGQRRRRPARDLERRRDLGGDRAGRRRRRRRADARRRLGRDRHGFCRARSPRTAWRRGSRPRTAASGRRSCRTGAAAPARA